MARKAFQAGELKFLPTATLIDIWERAGYVYESSGEVTLTAAGDLDAPDEGSYLETVFIAGSRPVVVYARDISYNGVGMNLLVYRDPTYTDGTEKIEYYNPNDINPQDNDPENGGDIIWSDATVSVSGTITRAPRYIFGNESNQGAGQPIRAITTPQYVPPGGVLNFYALNRSTTGTQKFASTLRWASVPNIEEYIFSESGAFVKYKGPIDQVTEQE